MDWRKDLEFLRVEIPKRHKNAFHAISRFREGIYVTAAEEHNRWAIGKRVSKIGNVAISEAITRVTPLVNRDNEMTIRDVLPNYLYLAEVLYYSNLSNDGSAAVFEVDVEGHPRHSARKHSGR